MHGFCQCASVLLLVHWGDEESQYDSDAQGGEEQLVMFFCLCSDDGTRVTVWLWVHEEVNDGSLELVRIKGTFNPAGLFTKH